MLTAHVAGLVARLLREQAGDLGLDVAADVERQRSAAEHVGMEPAAQGDHDPGEERHLDVDQLHADLAPACSPPPWTARRPSCQEDLGLRVQRAGDRGADKHAEQAAAPALGEAALIVAEPGAGVAELKAEVGVLVLAASGWAAANRRPAAMRWGRMAPKLLTNGRSRG